MTAGLLSMVKCFCLNELREAGTGSSKSYVHLAESFGKNRRHLGKGVDHAASLIACLLTPVQFPGSSQVLGIAKVTVAPLVFSASENAGQVPRISEEVGGS